MPSMLLLLNYHSQTQPENKFELTFNQQVPVTSTFFLIQNSMINI
jgi:hypothetical protein